MVKHVLVLLAAAIAAGAGPSAAARPSVIAPPAKLDAAVRQFVAIDSDPIVLRHVQLIDGTGRAPVADRTIVIIGGRIAAIGGPELAVPSGATVLDLKGRTVLPGIVGMHDHLFYIARPNLARDGSAEQPLLVPQMSFSAPRLYLAAGVTTIRTAGSVEPYADLNIKRLIDRGAVAGPRIDVTSPYLEGKNSRFVQMHQLDGAADAKAFVRYWAGEGATSIKAYISISRTELGAAIEEAHRLGLKVTGHLCSVTYSEAAELGIDNIEHGFFSDTALDPGKLPDICVPSAGTPTLQARGAGDRTADALIASLVKHNVAVTSTLAVFEQLVPGRPDPSKAALASLSPQALSDYRKMRAVRERAPPKAAAEARQRFRTAMELERRFVAAGGLLMAGSDPTGNGGVVPGFGNVRAIELLVEAGFLPEDAIRVATLNGATYLGLADRIGSVEVGKLADLLVVRGDPVRSIRALRDAEIVFKDGVGYDPRRLRASIVTRYGQY